MFGPSRKHPSDWLPLEISLEKQQRIIYGFLNSSNATNALKGPNLVHQGTLATVANSASDSGLFFFPFGGLTRFDYLKQVGRLEKPETVGNKVRTLRNLIEARSVKN